MLLAAILSPQECARSQGSVPLVARLRYFWVILADFGLYLPNKATFLWVYSKGNGSKCQY